MLAGDDRDRRGVGEDVEAPGPVLLHVEHVGAVRAQAVAQPGQQQGGLQRLAGVALDGRDRLGDREPQRVPGARQREEADLEAVAGALARGRPERGHVGDHVDAVVAQPAGVGPDEVVAVVGDVRRPVEPQPVGVEALERVRGDEQRHADPALGHGSQPSGPSAPR